MTSLVMGRTSAFGLNEVCAMEEVIINERKDEKMKSFSEVAIGTSMIN